MKRSIAFGLAFTLIFGALAACTIESDGSPIESDEPATNPPSTPGTPPTPTPPEETDLSVSLSASEDEGVAPLQVNFTATVSGDPSGDSWYVNDRQIERDGPRLTYTFRNAGEYLVTYSVSNDQGEIANDAVTVLVSASTEPTPPGEDPDPDPNPDPGPGNDNPTVTIAGDSPRPATVEVEEALDATAADPDGDNLAFQWSVTEGAAANVAFGSPTAEDTTVTFSAVDNYVLTLTVNDGQGGTATDTVTFNVAAVPTQSGGSLPEGYAGD